MAKLPSFAKAFAGRWRIVEMDVWDNDFLDLIEEAHLTFKGAADGEIAFGALKGFLDVRYGASDGSACAEFSWEGHDENVPACGRGWAVFGTAGRLVGHSTSITPTIQASSANAPDFFNTLLDERHTKGLSAREEPSMIAEIVWGKSANLLAMWHELQIANFISPDRRDQP
jgi:hypothetical protein